METDTPQLFIAQQEETHPTNNTEYLFPAVLYENDPDSKSGFVMLEIQEEPIDLTYNSKEDNLDVPPIVKQENFQLFSQNTSGTQDEAATIHYFASPENLPRKKRFKKSKMTATSSHGEMIMVNEIMIPAFDNSDISTILQEPKYQEILRAAKSLFSKRTRTLYHWMHPNASKQQIKFVVANSWDSLQVSEKEFYISQVMERFGYTQGNLMVNPQLNNIKDLPVLPKRYEAINAKARELQNAISSISRTDSTDTALSLDGPSARGSKIVLGDFYNSHNKTAINGAPRVKKRVKQSRPCFGEVKKSKPSNENIEFIDICNDFPDDPELSKEFAQFANTIKNKI